MWCWNWEIGIAGRRRTRWSPSIPLLHSLLSVIVGGLPFWKPRNLLPRYPLGCLWILCYSSTLLQMSVPCCFWTSFKYLDHSFKCSLSLTFILFSFIYSEKPKCTCRLVRSLEKSGKLWVLQSVHPLRRWPLEPSCSWYFGLEVIVPLVAFVVNLGS